MEEFKKYSFRPLDGNKMRALPSSPRDKGREMGEGCDKRQRRRYNPFVAASLSSMVAFPGRSGEPESHGLDSRSLPEAGGGRVVWFSVTIIPEKPLRARRAPYGTN